MIFLIIILWALVAINVLGLIVSTSMRDSGLTVFGALLNGVVLALAAIFLASAYL
jgi:hypothetical protein